MSGRVLTRGPRRCGRSDRGRTPRRSTPPPPAATAASGCTCTAPLQRRPAVLPRGRSQSPSAARDAGCGLRPKGGWGGDVGLGEGRSGGMESTRRWESGRIGTDSTEAAANPGAELGVGRLEQVNSGVCGFCRQGVLQAVRLDALYRCWFVKKYYWLVCVEEKYYSG